MAETFIKKGEVTKQYLGTNEASDYLDVTPQTLKLYVKNGLIKAERSRSGKLYFSVEELKKFITSEKA